MSKLNASAIDGFLEEHGEETLSHHGVKGMKWGVRRARKKAAKKAKAQKKADGEKAEPGDSKRTIRSKRRDDKNNRRRMSDKSLQEKIKRLENEKKLKDLINEDISPGKTFAKKILVNVGEDLLKSTLKGGGKYAFQLAAKKKFDMQEFADYVAPKPKKK